MPYAGDWGNLGYNGTSTLVGGGISWGQFAVSLNLGLVFVGTSQPSPDENATFRLGPNLFSDSIVALNIANGKMAWYFQTTPHDLWDFDRGWNVALGSATVGGKHIETVFKSCKNGYLYALNAETGKLIWIFDPPSVARIDTGNANYTTTGTYNPTQPWANYPSNQSFIQCPGLNDGAEADTAVAYGQIYIASYNFCIEAKASSVSTPSSSNYGISDLQYLTEGANTTIYALDASTGKESWSYFIPNVPYRGWLTVSGGVVFAGSVDGNVYMINAMTGYLISTLYLGTSLYTSPTIGEDTFGNMMLFQLTVSPAYGVYDQSVPGALLAFDLGPSPSGYLNAAEFYIAGGVLAVALAYLSFEAIRKIAFRKSL